MNQSSSPTGSPVKMYPQHDFVVNLFKAIVDVKSDTNTVASPVSLAQSLAMILAGAEGNTADQILKAVGVADEDALHQRIDSAKVGALGEKIQFLLGNRIFARRPGEILDSYCNAIRNLRGDVSQMGGEHRSSIVEVNAWVSGVTKRRVSRAVTEATPLPDLLVINAVFFRGIWATRFERQLVSKSPFYVTAEETVTVDMMFSRRDTPFLSVKEFDCQVLELPYEGLRCSMVLFLPNMRDGLSHMMPIITSENFGKSLDGLRKRDRVEVHLPKFHVSQQHEMAEALKELGITDVFDPAKANLTRMLKPSDRAIGQLVHDVALEVDEDGAQPCPTTTAGKCQKRSAICGPEFKVDHPFLYVLIAKPSNVVLFMGTICRPPQSMAPNPEPNVQ